MFAEVSGCNVRTELGHEQRQQVLRKLHAELVQGALELKIVDGARAVPVEMAEYILPVLGFVSIYIPPSTMRARGHTWMYRQRPVN